MQVRKIKANPVGIARNPKGRFNTSSAAGSYKYEPVRWSLGILVDKIPARNQLYWRQYPNGESTILVGIHESGYARVMCHVAAREEGYSGKKMTFYMADGSHKTFKGPWDSCAQGALGVGAPRLVNVAVTEKDHLFENSFTVSSQMELSVATKLVTQLDGFELCSDGVTYRLIESDFATNSSNPHA